MHASSLDQQIDQLIARHESAWQSGYGGFPAVVAERGLKRGVEVGVAFGGHSEAILQMDCVEQLTGVDSYEHRPGYDDPMNLSQPMFDRLHERTVERLSSFGQRFSLLRQASTLAADMFADHSLDFVYLDADHSEQGVFDDLCAWASKVRIGGVLAGHDYGHPDFPGVQRAVDRFVSRLGWQIHEAGEGVWWVVCKAISISYFTPCYNCEPWIQQTAASILEGNLQPHDQYILVNDGSNDDTASKLARLAERHAAVRVLDHPANRGGSAARNTAVEAAIHPLCFCLDADNLLLPNSVAGLRDLLLTTGADAAAFQTLNYFSDGDDPTATSHCLTFDDIRYDFDRVLQTTRMPGASGNYLFTKQSWERAGGYPQQAGALDAWGFGFRQCATGSVLRVLPGSAYQHRYGHDSYWTRQQQAGKINADAFTVIEPFLDRLHPADVRYLRSRKGQQNWFTDLDHRPLRTKSLSPALTRNLKPSQLLNRLTQIIRPAA